MSEWGGEGETEKEDPRDQKLSFPCLPRFIGTAVILILLMSLFILFAVEHV